MRSTLVQIRKTITDITSAGAFNVLTSATLTNATADGTGAKLSGLESLNVRRVLANYQNHSSVTTENALMLDDVKRLRKAILKILVNDQIQLERELGSVTCEAPIIQGPATFAAAGCAVALDLGFAGAPIIDFEILKNQRFDIQLVFPATVNWSAAVDPSLFLTLEGIGA